MVPYGKIARNAVMVFFAVAVWYALHTAEKKTAETRAAHLAAAEIAARAARVAADSGQNEAAAEFYLLAVHHAEEAGYSDMVLFYLKRARDVQSPPENRSQK